jgi:C4-dicarboxylate transporter, DcuC family
LQFALRDRLPRADRPNARLDDGPNPDEHAEVRYSKAVVPALPLVLLALDAFLGPTPLSRHLDGPGRILAAMLVGVAAAGLASPKAIGRLAAAFFDGAGYGYAHIISLIVAASTFAAAIERSGLIELATSALLSWPKAALAVAAVAPWALAVISGTGIAPAVALMEFFVPVAGQMGIDPVRLGTLSALGAHFGRTMSPAAAVVMMSSRVAGTPPADLIRLVALPLLAGGSVLLATALMGLV